MKQIISNIENIHGSIISLAFKFSDNQLSVIGSGFCIGKGKFLTCAHLFAPLNDVQKQQLLAGILVKHEFNGLDTYEWLPITIVKADINSDIALVEIKDQKRDLELVKPLRIGDSDKVKVGQDAYFIGFPYAVQLMNDGLGITLIMNKTTISNIKVDGVNPAHPRNLILVDAISNPGNSGCPLIDEETNLVIGVMGISFRAPSQKMPDLDIHEPMHIAGARPINTAKKIIEEINK